MFCNILESNHYGGERTLKSQMNRFTALPSPNTKKNHPKWDLGKEFSSQAFIER